MGVTASAVVRGHWFNGWFLRLFGRPFLVVEGQEIPVEWAEPISIELAERPLSVGAGVRYVGRGPLLGYEPQLYEGHLSGAPGTPRVTFRNGFWNHTPFRLVH